MVDEHDQNQDPIGAHDGEVLDLDPGDLGEELVAVNEDAMNNERGDHQAGRNGRERVAQRKSLLYRILQVRNRDDEVGDHAKH